MPQRVRFGRECGETLAHKTYRGGRMNINDAYASKYLKAADLLGKEYRVIIGGVAMEQVVEEEPDKPILHFQGGKKGMVLNKTNAMEMQSALGDETADWVGAPIVLFTAKVQFNGKVVDGLRIRLDTTASSPPVHPDPEPPLEQPPAQSGPPTAKDDGLPF